MGFLHRLLGENRADKTVEAATRPDVREEDVLLRLQELQTRVAELRADVQATRAWLWEMLRRYPYTS
jgi:hypothetical protein